MKAHNRLLLSALCIVMALSLISCDQKISKLSKFLVQSDGETYTTLSELHYEVKDVYNYDVFLTDYPFQIQYNNARDIYIMRSDGLLVYDAASGIVEPISISEEFSYHIENLLQCTEDPNLQYFYTRGNLYGIQDRNYSLVQSGIRTCVGLPYSSQLSLLLSDGVTLQHFGGGKGERTEFTLPRAAKRAFYFEQSGKIVYQKLYSKTFYSCQSDGSQDSLLFTCITQSVSDYRTMYPIDATGKFITTSRIDNDDYVILIDALSGSHQALRRASYAYIPDYSFMPLQLSLSSDRSHLLLLDPYSLCKLNLNDLQTENISLSNVSNISSACISADGSSYGIIGSVE